MSRTVPLALVVISTMLLTACVPQSPVWTRIAADGTITVSPCADSTWDAFSVEYGTFNDQWAIEYQQPLEIEFTAREVDEGDLFTIDQNLVKDAGALQPVSDWDTVLIQSSYVDYIELNDEDVDEGEWVRFPAEAPFAAQCEQPAE